MPSKMGDLNSNIDDLIISYHNVTSMLRARGKVISESDDISLLLRSFLQCKDEVFRDYMERNKEQYEEENASTLTIDKLILLAQNNYNERTKAR